LTANAGAELNTWRIVVVGSTGFGGGTVDAATQFANLTVADTYFDMVVGKTAAEQGQEAQLPVQITKKQDFEGNATAQLLGLPTGTTCEPVEFNKDATEIVFKMHYAGHRVGELEVSHFARLGGQSSLKFLKTSIDMFLFLIYMRLKLLLYRRKLIETL